MIDKKTVREHLYLKYIEPTKKERELYIGIELELSMGREKELHTLNKRFSGYYRSVTSRIISMKTLINGVS